MNATSIRVRSLSRRGRAAVALVLAVGFLTVGAITPTHIFAIGASNGGGQPGVQYDVCNASASTSGTNVTIEFQLKGDSASPYNGAGAGSGTCSSLDNVNQSSKHLVLTVSGVQNAAGTLVLAGGSTLKFGGQAYSTTVNMAGQPAGYYTLLVSDNLGTQYRVPFYYSG